MYSVHESTLSRSCPNLTPPSYFHIHLNSRIPVSGLSLSVCFSVGAGITNILFWSQLYPRISGYLGR